MSKVVFDLSKTVNCSLSNDDLTLILTSVNGKTRATKGITSGKYYLEFKVSTTGAEGLSFGFSNLDTYAYNTPTSWYYQGYFFPSGTQGANSALVANDLVSLAIDLDSPVKTVRFYKNGTLVKTENTPISFDGKVVYPFVNHYYYTPLPTITANFGATEFDIVQSNPTLWEQLKTEGYLPYDIDNAGWFLYNCLVESEGDIYTIQSTVWQNTGILGLPTESDFMTVGFSDLKLITDSLLRQLINPKILLHSKNISVNSLKCKITPKPQLIIPKDDIIIDSLDSINNFILTTNESGSGIVRTIFSIDGGFTWMTYNTVSLQFEFIDISNLNNVKLNGIDTTTFNSLGIKWNEIITEGKVRFAYYLEKELITDVAEISQLRINMDYTDSWSKSIHPTEYTYKFDNTGSYVTFLVDGTYKVNYIELVDVNETCGADIAWGVF